MKLGAGAGHGGNDPGALSQGNTEAVLNRMMNAVMIEVGRERGVTMVNLTVEKGYPYNINEPAAIANSNKVDVAIQNHFNAAGGTGVEVLYHSSNKAAGVQAAQMSAAIANAYGLKDRGAKPRDNLGFLNQTQMRAYIIEWGFVDAPNNTDVPRIKNDPLKGIKAVFTAMGIPENKPNNVVNITDNMYRVRKSWDDPKSQLGAYKSLDNAKAVVDQNKVTIVTYPFNVFDDKGQKVYP